jgi:2-polyprenyl-6-methoxyphenol hydroxylase-like FAD-dependent oxidoreductase
MRVMIIGGGIGGLCLAQGLTRAGVESVVYERDVERAERLDRYRLHINPAGSRALHACLTASAWESFLAGTREYTGGFGFLTERMRTLVVVDDAIMYPWSTDPAEQARPADRRFLREVLLSGLDGTVQFGRKFDHYELLPDGAVTAHFTDGTSATGDVLVGADGAGSAVRRQYLPGAEPVPTGALGIGWTVPLDSAAGQHIPERLRNGMNMVMTAAPFFLFTSVFRRRAQEAGEASSQTAEYLLCALVVRRDACEPGIESFDGPAVQTAVAGMISRWHPDLLRLATEADPETFGPFPFAAAPPPGNWASTSVTLIGDAIHCMPPVGGLGANMALRDASLLSLKLTATARGEISLQEAISGYETEMRDYAFGAVRSALTNQRRGLNASPAAQAGMRTWFRLCNAVPALKRAGFKGSWGQDARARSWEHHPAGRPPLSPLA